MLQNLIQMKIKILISSLLIVFLYSCQKEKRETQDYYMNLIEAELYLKDVSNEGGIAIPSIILKFKFQNNTDEYNFFSTKQNFSDKRNLSRFYLIDTLKNQVIQIYSGDKTIIKPKTKVEINGIIEIRDFKDYFDLNNSFLNKTDFFVDKKLIEFKTNEMLNNSIILYVQDSLDIKPFLAINSKKLPIKPIGNDIIIKVRKEHIKSKVFTPKKLKKLKEIN